MENSALNATQCLLKNALLLPNLISQCLLIGQKGQAEECLGKSKKRGKSKSISLKVEIRPQVLSFFSLMKQNIAKQNNEQAVNCSLILPNTLRTMQIHLRCTARC